MVKGLLANWKNNTDQTSSTSQYRCLKKCRIYSDIFVQVTTNKESQLKCKILQIHVFFSQCEKSAPFTVLCLQTAEGRMHLPFKAFQKCHPQPRNTTSNILILMPIVNKSTRTCSGFPKSTNPSTQHMTPMAMCNLVTFFYISMLTAL